MVALFLKISCVCNYGAVDVHFSPSYAASQYQDVRLCSFSFHWQTDCQKKALVWWQPQLPYSLTYCLSVHLLVWCCSLFVNVLYCIRQMSLFWILSAMMIYFP